VSSETVGVTKAGSVSSWNYLISYVDGEFRKKAPFWIMHVA